MRVVATVASMVIGLLFAPSGIAAQDASCIGTITPNGMEFSGSGSTISEPFHVDEGLLFSQATMTQAGALKLMNAEGDTVLLGNDSDPYETTEAVTVYTAGDYYLVADFYSDEGDWAVTIEQPGS